LFNSLIVGGSLWAGYWGLAIAWAAGLASVFPFFNATRQLLEHRDELADDSANYAEVAHGRVNRLRVRRPTGARFVAMATKAGLRAGHFAYTQGAPFWQ
jgi:hypothetical protein